MATPTINWNSASKDYGTVDFTNDTDLIVNFYNRSVVDPQRSTSEGMPIHKDMVYVKIMRAGEQLNIIDRPMVDQDRRRFARQYENFLHNKSQVPEGTPIELLFPNNPAVADNLRGRGVYTIQQCANLTAHAIESIGMGAQEYVNRAKKYIEAAASGQSFIKYQEEMKKKEAQIALLKRQQDEMRAQIDGLIAKMSDPSAKLDAAGNRTIGHVHGYDAQEARINATHVTQDIKRGRKSKYDDESSE
jgi:hypothetical protein